jgi:hypothetical protein
MSLPRSSPFRLVIVPCGRAKIWDRHPDAGPTAAAHAYTGAPFTVNRQYAEQAGGDWMILSAKYGFLRPTCVIPGPYETTFKRRGTNPIGLGPLRDQVAQLGLDRYSEVIGLGERNTGPRLKLLLREPPWTSSFRSRVFRLAMRWERLRGQPPWQTAETIDQRLVDCDGV